ncbi:MAG: DEAD/DEAH box helicase [Spirochaetaceae bacterium]
MVQLPMKFTDFSFSQKILQGIQDAKFEECTPVQEEVFRHAMEDGRDVTVQSKTGTGKTAAFLLTIFEKFTRDDNGRHKALIVAPTRELAVQIDEEAQLLSGGLSLKTASFYGGVGYKQQERDIKEGVDIIIGTPGRLLDFAQSKKLSFKDVDTLVIDEADRLFDMGFLPDLKKILRHMSGPQKRQTMLFSATLGMKIQQLAWEFLYEPKEIIISNDSITVDEISQVLYHVSTGEKFKLLLGIIEQENPANAVIFTNTKHAAVKIAKRLNINGYHAEYIMGDLPQKKRLSIIEKIKSGELRILVATDVAARGLHINDLDMVINYDIPEDPENYVHRVGRTARAGNTGKAVTLACERLVFGLEPVEEFIKMKIPVQRASEELLQTEDKSAGMHVSSGLSKPSNDRSRDRRGGSKNSRGSRDSRGPRDSKGPKKSTRDHRGEKKKRPPVNAESKGKQSDIEKRLEYYRKKYGENFEVKET